jgi:Carboxypeptidase regulatory-like domain/TonB dependent receptor
MSQRIAHLFVYFALLCATALSVGAQESRGSLTGRVTDASGAAIPNAQVSIVNVATNTATTITTNSEGSYTALYLLPGQYRVTVESAGFKKLIREGIEIQIGDKAALDVQLEPGALTDTVTVTGDSTPLLDTATASSGQVIDRRRISELPLAEGNPLTLVRLAPSTVITGGFTSLAALSTSGPSDFQVDGNPQGGNEFTLDGSPNTADRGGQAGGLRVSLQPPVDAVAEFKVVNTNFDAQQGHTSGASVDVSVRSGTNQFHGTLYEFVRNDALGANDFYLNRTASLGLDSDGKARRQARRYNRYGGTIGGPIHFPGKVFGPLGGYNGRDRSFFFFSHEQIRLSGPFSETLTLPIAAFRAGDFSSLTAGQLVYDPATARQIGARVERQPLQCNGRANVICDNRISPIARAYFSFMPLPNIAGTENNYLGSYSERNDYKIYITRVDHQWSEKHRSFFRYSYSHRNEDDENTLGNVNGVRLNGRFGTRGTKGGVFDHIWSRSASTIVNLRVGYTRFRQTRDALTDDDTSPTNLGFAPRTIAAFGARTGIPRIRISNISDVVEQTGLVTVPRTSSVQPTVTKIAGNHNMRFGYDFRVYQENRTPVEYKLGEIQFGNNFTRLNDQNPSLPVNQIRAQAIASFLLGIPTSGTYPNTPSVSVQSQYHGMFFQDDWKVSRRLTLNLGLRYEIDTPTTERFNRNIRGFDPNVTTPVTVPGQTLRGGLGFVSADQRGFYDIDKNNFQPRAGFAYQVNEKTVVRGGFALYTAPVTLDGIFSTGFATATPIDPSPDLGLTFTASLADPFQRGINQPTGSSLGLLTFLGQNINFVPTNRKHGNSQRYEISFQRELPGKWVGEVAWIANRGYDLEVAYDLNPVPEQFLSKSPVRDQAVIDNLTANVTNPFRGIEAFRGTTLFTATTIQRQQAVRPFPHFGSIVGRRFDGSSWYNSMQARLERRFSGGYTLLGTYTLSRSMEEISLLNPTDTKFERRLSGADSTHRINLSGIYELPWGRGRKFGSNWGKWADALLGGFQLNGLYYYATGTPITLGNVYYNGDIKNLKMTINSRTIGALGTSNITDNVFQTGLTGLGFYFQDATVQTNGALDYTKQRNDARINLANNLRTLPTRVSNLRNQPVNLVDLSLIKNFAFTETVKLQLRIEAINAFNHWQFQAPDLGPRNSTFGRVTNSSQIHLPREYQLGLKLLF